MSDLINRQAAIDAVNRLPKWSDAVSAVCLDYSDVISVLSNIEELPSAQIEPLTDMEQRIFLAAMGREYKICKKADEEYYGIDNINLVRVCREIERKVKKALWTN